MVLAEKTHFVVLAEKRVLQFWRANVFCGFGGKMCFWWKNVLFGFWRKNVLFGFGWKMHFYGFGEKMRFCGFGGKTRFSLITEQRIKL